MLLGNAANGGHGSSVVGPDSVVVLAAPERPAAEGEEAVQRIHAEPRRAAGVVPVQERALAAFGGRWSRWDVFGVTHAGAGPPRSRHTTVRSNRTEKRLKIDRERARRTQNDDGRFPHRTQSGSRSGRNALRTTCWPAHRLRPREPEPDAPTGI